MTKYPTAQETWEHLRKLEKDPANLRRYIRYRKRLFLHGSRRP